MTYEKKDHISSAEFGIVSCPEKYSPLIIRKVFLDPLTLT